MKKLEIYYDDHGLKATIYPSTLSDNPYHVKNTEVVELIQRSYIEKILNVSDNLDKKDVSIVFEGCQLVIKDYEKIFKNKALYDLFEPLLLNAKEFLEDKELKKLKNKRVVRKNKYVSRIIAVGLSAASILTTAISIKAINKNTGENINIERQVVYAPEFEYNSNKLFDYSTNEVSVENANDEVFEINEVEETSNFDTTNIGEDKEIDIDNTILIEYEDDIDNPDIKYVKDKYGDLIEKYSKMYGLDSNVIIAMVVGESSGRHEKYLEGHAAIGLMQIERSLDGENLKAYNFETKEWERSTLNIEELKDVEKNIIAGCKILQTNLRYWNYNALLAIQSYNMGFGNMKTILETYEGETGITREDVENNVTDTGWIIGM